MIKRISKIPLKVSIGIGINLHAKWGDDCPKVDTSHAVDLLQKQVSDSLLTDVKPLEATARRKWESRE